MGDAPGFPTQGELIRFAYDIAGVLPEKHDPFVPRGSTRDSMRKAIARLAQEEGKLEENFGELLKQLSGMVAGYAAWLPVHMLIGDVFNDFIDGYRDLLIEEGTYLDRQSTVRWLIRDRWVASTAFSLARSVGKWKPSMLLPFRPAAQDWFLPDFTDRGVIWPMRKALEWLYATAGLSQTQFHYPNRDAAESDFEKKRQLENAQNWVSGRNLPSAAALHASLHSAIHGREEPIAFLNDPRRLMSAEAVLLLARMSTAIWKAVVDEYGETFAKDVRTQFCQLWLMLVGELGAQERELVALSIDTGASRTNPQLRNELLSHWGRDMAVRSNAVSRELNAITAAGSLPTEAQYLQLINKYGSLPVEALAVPLRSGRLHEVPECFLNAYSEWRRLHGSRETTSEEIDAFDAFLRTHRLAEALSWMPAWLRFQQAYRQEEYPAAWAAIKLAYDAAKYRAGHAQYEIVNQYVEMAAKCGTHQEFQRGVSWARYIGLDIRWIRDLPLTLENLKFAKTILQRATYAV